MIIDDEVMTRLKEEAARRRTTVTSIVDAALRELLDRPPVNPDDVPTLPRFDLGQARVDVADREALYQAMEGR